MYSIINNYILNLHILPAHFDKYNLLKERLHNLDSIIGDNEFQHNFCNYWRLNSARLSQQYKEHYFQILQNYRANGINANEIGVATMNNIVGTLYEVPVNARGQIIQFSFATKLFHSINNNLPIYDSKIKKFYYLQQPDNGSTHEQRVRFYMQQYQFLIQEYKRILENNLLDISIHHIRNTFHLEIELTDVKIIDTIIWSFVKCLEQGYIEQNHILFQ